MTTIHGVKVETFGGPNKRVALWRTEHLREVRMLEAIREEGGVINLFANFSDGGTSCRVTTHLTQRTPGYDLVAAFIDDELALAALLAAELGRNPIHTINGLLAHGGKEG